MNIVYPNEENFFMVPNNKKKGFKNACYLISRMNFDLKEIGEKELFLLNQSTNIVYPNKENMFILPNNKRKGDCYKNTRLSLLIDEL